MSTKKKKTTGRRELTDAKLPPGVERDSGSPEEQRLRTGRLDSKRRMSGAATVAGFLFVGTSFGLPYLAPDIARSLGNGGLFALRIIGVLLVVGGWYLGRDDQKKKATKKRA